MSVLHCFYPVESTRNIFIPQSQATNSSSVKVSRSLRPYALFSNTIKSNNVTAAEEEIENDHDVDDDDDYEEREDCGGENAPVASTALATMTMPSYLVFLLSRKSRPKHWHWRIERSIREYPGVSF